MYEHKVHRVQKRIKYARHKNYNVYKIMICTWIKRVPGQRQVCFFNCIHKYVNYVLRSYLS